jgi:peptidoglycan hydrolase-like protein with peptidoglycan-binding domain
MDIQTLRKARTLLEGIAGSRAPVALGFAGTAETQTAAATLLASIARQLRAGARAPTNVGQDAAPLDTCGPLGPARSERDEDNPGSGFPPLVWNAPKERQDLQRKRRARPTVGFAQLLLNDFLARLRLGTMRELCAVSDSQLTSLIPSLPTWLAIDCTFGPQTELVTKAFQVCSGLKADGKLGIDTWRALLRRTARPLSKRALEAVPAAAVLGLVSEPGPPASVGQVRCAKTHAPARSFADLVALVRSAEVLLSAANPGCAALSELDRLSAIRGIYYGTTWSRDFAKEQSPVRNLGFNRYARGSTFALFNAPFDVRPCLSCRLFEALGASQDARDGGRHVDFGHLIIGLEARAAGQVGPLGVGFGYSGLEAVTWLGDLGGAAAMIARDRASRPSTRARTRFAGKNFGGSINLEGDIAAYVVAQDAALPNRPAAPDFRGGTLATALEAYLEPNGPSPGGPWLTRATRFLVMHGGVLSGNKLTNRSALVASFAAKIGEFACEYLVNRLRQQGKLNSALLERSMAHIPGAAVEVASIFVDALIACHAAPHKRLAAVTDPAPNPAGTAPLKCRTALRGLKALESASSLLPKGALEALGFDGN